MFWKFSSWLVCLSILKNSVMFLLKNIKICWNLMKIIKNHKNQQVFLHQQVSKHQLISNFRPVWLCYFHHQAPLRKLRSILGWTVYVSTFTTQSGVRTKDWDKKAERNKFSININDDPCFILLSFDWTYTHEKPLNKQSHKRHDQIWKCSCSQMSFMLSLNRIKSFFYADEHAQIFELLAAHSSQC